MKNYSKKSQQDKEFIQSHILDRKPFEAYEKEETMQQKAKKAFYAVWSNWIFINPTTKNLRDIEEKDFSLIKKLSYGSKNRLQSYIAYHLNKDHYEMNFSDFSDEQSLAIIEMCREVFENTKLLVDWWRKPLQDNPNQTGEEWFKECKERFQHRKLINKLGFCFIDLETKEFLICENNEVIWTTNQNEATRFNTEENGLTLDQELDTTKTIVFDKIKTYTKCTNLKMFVQQRNQYSNEIFV